MAIADWSLAEVSVVNPDGEWQGAVMTRGEGPGEVQAPAPLTWVDANTLLVLDFGVYRLTTLDLASRSACVTAVAPAFLSPVFMSGEATFVAVQPDQTVWLEFPGPIEDGWEERSFVRWSPENPVNDRVVRFPARAQSGVTLPACFRPGWHDSRSVLPSGGGVPALAGGARRGRR